MAQLSPFRISPPAGLRRRRGFTLIELMVTVAIVALLATVGLNAYSSATSRARRAAVQSYLQDIANRQEQRLLYARAYATSAADAAMPTPPDDVVGFYTVTVSANNAATPPSFTVTATPVGSQASNDSRCGTLSLNQAGVRTRSGSAALKDCW